jgi:hypothetical protein
MKLIPMVDVSEGADEERMSIAKLLTVSAASNVMLVIDLCRYLTWCLRSCPSP